MYKSLIVVILLIATSFFTATAQPRYFSGTITYKITYPANASSPMIAALPSTINMQIAANRARFELTLPNGKQTFIINGDEISIIRLIEMTEGNFFIKKTREEFQQGDAPVVLPLKEAKTVAGYKCKSAEINATDRGGKVQKTKVFYSEELGNNNIYFNTVAKAVKGIMLDFDYNTLGVMMHLTATEVIPGRISNKTFEIPSGYQETTEAKLQQLRQASRSK